MEELKEYAPLDLGQENGGLEARNHGDDEKIAPRSHECKQYPFIRLSRRKAVRLRCLDCSAGRYAEVEHCGYTVCDLHPYRTGKGKQDPRGRSLAIKAHCSWCSNSRAEVIHCPVSLCPLFPFRKFKVDQSTGTLPILTRKPRGSDFQTSDNEGIHMEAPGNEG